ncbi:MAG: family 16 glycosylhydrolase [Chitinophagales bacterium]
MKKLNFTFILFYSFLTLNAQTFTIQDDFEGNGTINTWFGDDCSINTAFSNPYQMGINTSSTVLEYKDTGGEFANVRFDLPTNFESVANHAFSLKIYVPSNGLTGTQPNQVSLKLQDGTLAAPWSTQSEIIKPVSLDQWQTLVFDFENGNFINLDPNSPPPTQRNDFNRIVIQVNGENNTDRVLAYVDDVNYIESLQSKPVFDRLVWSDEFDNDGAIDGSKWFQQNKLPEGGSWYNGEIQHYTDRMDNSFVENGVLKIVAKKETYSDQGVTKDYTSARLNSKFAFTYGKVEVRAKLPFGVGTWPAIWMLSKNINEDGAYWDNQGFGTTPWPACGEIDIMEHWGNNQNFVQSAMHTPSSFGNTFNKGGQFIGTASTEFHIYTLEWTAEKMVFSVDDVVHYTYEPPVKDASTWPFDSEQYLLLNVAILPEIPSSFTSDAMEIDYVRVFQESNDATSIIEVPTGENLSIYPNPFLNNLNVDFEQAVEQNVALRLYRLDGQLIDTYSVPLKNNKIILNNLGELAKGMYLIQFSLGTENYSFKIIKN